MGEWKNFGLQWVRNLMNQVTNYLYFKKIKGDSKDKIINKILFKRINGFLSTESKFYRLVLDFLYTIKAALVLPNEIDIIVTNTFGLP